MKPMTLFLQMLWVGLLLALGIGAIVSLIGWLTGWMTARQFSDGLFLSAAVIVILGFLAIVGGITSRADFGIVYSQSAGDMSASERTRQMMTEIVRGYRVLVMSAIIGTFLVFFSILVYQIFG